MAKLFLKGVDVTEDGGFCLLLSNGDTVSLISKFENIPSSGNTFTVLRVDFVGNFSASIEAALTKANDIASKAWRKARANNSAGDSDGRS